MRDSRIALHSAQLPPLHAGVLLPLCAACCAGAGGAGWAYKRLNNPRAAAVAGLFSASYLFAG